jgi:threonine 3-dehydrogenase
MRQMLARMNNGGKIALLGIAPTEFAVDWNQIIFKMLQVKGIYGREMFETWYKMIALVQSGLDLSPLITHRIGIDRFDDGFAAMLSGEAGKVVMDWN